MRNVFRWLLSLDTVVTPTSPGGERDTDALSEVRHMTLTIRGGSRQARRARHRKMHLRLAGYPGE
jgi:hypothetical protein